MLQATNVYILFNFVKGNDNNNLHFPQLLNTIEINYIVSLILEMCDMGGIVGNLERYRLIYEIMVNRYKSEFERTYQIERKATNIVGFVGIIFSLVSIAGIFLLEQTFLGNVFIDSILYYLLSLIALILSIIFGLMVLYVKMRAIVPNPNIFKEYFIDKNIGTSDILRKISNDLVVAVNNNKKANDRNINLLIFSYITFIVGIILTGLFILSLLMNAI